MKKGVPATSLVGQKFNRLLVVELSHTSRQGSFWKCLCDCGAKVVVCGSSLKIGKARSCGCYKKERTSLLASLRRTTHGLSRTPTHKIWCGMKQRCLNPKRRNFSDYGGRGITVSKEWMSFENFLKDMGERPSSKHSIERKNNDGNYEKGNCCWATNLEQAQNKRILKANKTGVSGVYYKRQCNKYQARITLNGRRISLGYFTSVGDAINARHAAGQAYQQ